jgi:GNAT superfamily N-acetyltransferase
MLSEPAPLEWQDLDGCLRLSEEAGWNQNVADWRFILREAWAIGIRRESKLVATAAVIPYGPRFGWICMVLVTASERRQGVASRLMRECVGWMQARDAVAGLDATTAGREVYRQIGFQDVYPISRLERLAATSPSDHVTDATIRKLDPAMLREIAAYDRARFGGERARLLATWFDRAPEAAHFASARGRVTGFVLAREGRAAMHIGPLVADDEETGLVLLRAGLQRIAGPVFIDIPDRHRLLRAWLEAHAFKAQRTFTRMLLGRSEPLDSPAHVMALTGAEFG